MKIGLVSGNVLGLDKAKLTEYCTKWTEGAGDIVDSLGTFLGGLSKKGIDELNALSGVKSYIFQALYFFFLEGGGADWFL